MMARERVKYKNIGHPQAVDVEIALSRDGKQVEIYVEWEDEAGSRGTNIDIPVIDVLRLISKEA